MDFGQLGIAMIAALSGGAAVAAIQAIAGRRQVSATVDVTLSAEARQWAELFRNELEAQRTQHAAEIAALTTRVNAMAVTHATELRDREHRIAALEAEVLDERQARLQLQDELDEANRRVAELTQTVDGLRARLAMLEGA